MPGKTAGPGKAAKCFFYRAKPEERQVQKLLSISQKEKLFPGVFIADLSFAEKAGFVKPKEKAGQAASAKRKTKKNRKRQGLPGQKKKTFRCLGNFGEEIPQAKSRKCTAWGK